MDDSFTVKPVPRLQQGSYSAAEVQLVKAWLQAIQTQFIMKVPDLSRCYKQLTGAAKKELEKGNINAIAGQHWQGSAHLATSASIQCHMRQPERPFFGACTT